MKFADLHLHSHFSDGTYAPEEVAAQALRCKLSAIALTDHDSVEGCQETARECARTLVWDPGRARQSPYADPKAGLAPLKPDGELARAEEWIKGRIGKKISVAAWARGSSLGDRSLERRWKAAYGRSPVAWLRSARIAMAKGLLESGGSSWEAITAACGYADPSRFRAAFMALPMSFGEAAPVSATAFSTAAAISSSVTSAGR